MLDIHEIFFIIPVDERMALIAHSRQLEQDRKLRESVSDLEQLKGYFCISLFLPYQLEKGLLYSQIFLFIEEGKKVTSLSDCICMFPDFLIDIAHCL